MKEKIALLKKKFQLCSTAQDRYKKIIELGQNNPPLPKKYKVKQALVSGCQSRMYLHIKEENGKLFFHTEADALISNGLGSLLTQVYSGESPETVLTQPPTYLEELEITSSLSPNRANGLASLFLHMKRAALKILTQTNR